jgi:hypothetical protein
MSNLVPSIQISKTRKHLIAENVPAPVIPGMAAANYTGGSLLHSNFQLAGSAEAPLLTHLPVPEQATPGVARGGSAGPRRIAPTPAPQHGFGKTAVSRKAHAVSLTPEQREAIAMEYVEIVRALEEVAKEEGDESWSFEMKVFEKKNEEKKPKQGKKRRRGE